MTKLIASDAELLFPFWAGSHKLDRQKRLPGHELDRRPFVKELLNALQAAFKRPVIGGANKLRNRDSPGDSWPTQSSIRERVIKLNLLL